MAGYEAKGAGNDRFAFWKGAQDVLSTSSKALDWASATKLVRDNLADALGARHVSFLLGSGCSSLIREGKQVGIPTMAALASAFASKGGDPGAKDLLSKDDRTFLSNVLGIDVLKPPFDSNIETLLEVLTTLHFALAEAPNSILKEAFASVESILKKAHLFIFEQCTNGSFTTGDDTVVSLYQAFYKKLVFRDRALPRPWVFTTNYDLFSETAMDRLSIPYSNGFAGTVERRFNPANFRYALGEQLDITTRKWVAADSFVYLCKLHGSVNWIEDKAGLFPIRELQAPSQTSGRLMIYPTPMKQAATFGAPYSDLFREFQARVVREQSVLFVLGYRLGDQHVNNIIFQALTIPTFRLVLFIDPEGVPLAKTLRALADPRIWIIGGAGPDPKAKAHYLETFVDHFMPSPPGDKVDEAVTRIRELLLGNKPAGSSENGNVG